MLKRAIGAGVCLGVVACGGGQSPDADEPTEARTVAVTEGARIVDGALDPEVSISQDAWLSDGHVLPVFEVGGARWVQLADAPFFDHPGFEAPSTWGETEGAGETVPASPVALEGAPAGDYAVLVTPAGTCFASLGAPVFVNRTGCVADAALARPIEGCEGPIAPLAWLDNAPPSDVTWAPVELVDQWAWLDNEAEVPTLRSQAPFSLLAAYESELYTDMLANGLAADNFESAATMGWAFAGEEVVSVLMAGAHSIDTAECQDWADAFVTVGFEGDAGWESLAEDFVLTGVLAQDGRAQGLVAGARRSLKVLARGADGAFEPVFDDAFWFENEECAEPWTPVSFELDCAP